MKPGFSEERGFWFGKRAGLIVLISAIGCGPSLIKVNGQVTRNGEPVRAGKGEKLHVIFYSASAATSKESEAYPANVKHAEGTYQIPGQRGKGIPPGEYRVSVQLWNYVTNTDRLKNTFGPTNSPIIREVTGDRAAQEISIDLAKPAE